MAEITGSAVTALKALLGEERAVYFSTPITSGDALLEFLRSHQSKPTDVEKKQIVLQNTIRSRAAALKLRQSHRYVINPADFEVEVTPRTSGWDQATFRAFWVEVIKRYCDRVIVAEDWWLSYGCCVEVLSALAFGINVGNELGQTIALKEAKLYICQGLKDYATFSITWPEVEELLKRL